jgi:hypothetical protein
MKINSYRQTGVFYKYLLNVLLRSEKNCDARMAHNSKLKCVFDKIYSKILFYLSLFINISLLFCSNNLNGQTNETFKSGAYIINMGVTPQTVDNGLKPYGLIYDLVTNYSIPIKWVINTGKAKDGIDFSYGGINFRGGPFIIESEYRTTSVNARINYWQSQGVVGTTTTASITIPVYYTIQAMPRWTMDKQNGQIAVGFFQNAGIPSSAHGGTSQNAWKLPSELACCDDLFVMPHADPEWSSHGNLYNWNQSCNGSIWLGCHAGSALEDMFNPASPTQQTNFLTEKTATATGAGPYSENALKLWKNHDSGTVPYSYALFDDPVMQFMGTIDAATQNGSEQIFIPMAAGWRPTTKIGVYDPDHPQVISSDPKHRAVALAYGRGFGDSGRGYVLLEVSHDIDKVNGTAKVAAQRAFFNFSILSANSRAVTPNIVASVTNDTIYSGNGVGYTFTLPSGANLANYSIKWTSACGGTFTPSSTQQNVTFIPPSVTGPTPCFIYVTISDACGRSFDDIYKVIVTCSINVTSTATNPKCAGSAMGKISFAPTGGNAPYTYKWAKGVTTGTGTGTSILGLSAGTYSVTVNSANGCSKIFSQTLTEPSVLNVTASSTNILCYGQKIGSIDATVSGGTTPYTYNWGGGVTSQDRTGLTAGTYSLTVLDAQGCNATISKTITQPTAILSVSGTITQANCGGTMGSINITAVGGTTPYTYNWGAAITSEDRTGLAAGNYTVTVTDANSCTVVRAFSVTQPTRLALSTVLTHPTCPTPVADGAIDLSVTGGTSPYNYDWADVVGTNNSQDRIGLSVGTYTVVVTDANGCTATISATLTAQNTLPNPPSGVNH